MRYAPRALLAGGLGFAASFLVACGGSSGLLSGDQAIALNGQLDQISSAVQSGNCGAAVNASAALNNAVQTLPATVNPTLRRNLSQGASTIAELARKDCRSRPPRPPPRPTTRLDHHHLDATSTSTSTSTSTPTTHEHRRPRTSTTATTPTDTGTTSTTTGGVGLGGGTTTTTTSGNGSGGAGPGSANSSGTGGGG